jgi:hypothetical protein
MRKLKQDIFITSACNSSSIYKIILNQGGLVDRLDSMTECTELKCSDNLYLMKSLIIRADFIYSYFLLNRTIKL